MFRTNKPRTTKMIERVLAEATAIVEGRAQNLPRLTQGSTRISQLAHASWSDLHRLAATQTFDASWEGAASYLASAIMTQTGSANGLLALQHNGLIPLERSMLGRSVRTPQTPSELVSVVCTEVNSPRLLNLDARQGPTST
jgi:hypothetical protein